MYFHFLTDDNESLLLLLQPQKWGHGAGRPHGAPLSGRSFLRWIRTYVSWLKETQSTFGLIYLIGILHAAPTLEKPR